ncbi:MAG: ferritin-like domain-containing protein [Candidatus Dadabacteria bacterium]|nr:MAG: ferritin-like domain-containing protein [Candidatus Dadabacteria bacterium]
MSVKFVDQTPTEIKYTTWTPLAETTPDPHEHDDLEDRLKPEHVEHIAEIFQTPLTGSYSWDYEECDQKIRRLYRLGKELNWNAEIDVDWSYTHPKTEFPFDEALNPFKGTNYDDMTEEEKLDVAWHNHCWTQSQFLHGEQGALLVASQLVTCAPTYDAKLYAASQTFDEARHVEVFGKYLNEKVGFMYPINRHLKALLDKILTDPRWDLKFIGMQIIIEGLALAAFRTTLLTTRDPLMRQIVDYVIRDEARHVAFGVLYMEEFVKSLSEEEREERAQFAYEACCVMRERLIATDVFAHFGWDVEFCRRTVLESQVMDQFRNLLFTRVMPNLKKVGLLTDRIRPKYEELGILQYENLADDGMIDWAQLEQKYPEHQMPQA